MVTMPSIDTVIPLASMVSVMKPGAVKEDDTKGLAKLEECLNSGDYALEEKYDGCRYKMISNYFFSKDNVEKTHNFPHLHDFFTNLGMPNLILDGEIYYPGKTSQYCTRVTGCLPDTAIDFQQQNGYIHYVIYDILRAPNGTWLCNKEYKERRKMLEFFYDNYIKPTPMAEFIHISDVRYEQKAAYLQSLLEAGLEGGVLKRLDSLYLMGKKPKWQWMKVKQSDEADLIITGFVPPKKNYTGKNLEGWLYWEYDEELGEEIPVTKNYKYGWPVALECSAYVDGQLTKICQAAGLTEDMKEDMKNNPENWLYRVTRVSYMELTDDGYPRHPKFHSLHEDKTQEECLWEFTE